ncbi:MAG: hypothetical protein ABSF84_10470 [Acidimicrobiales bacterium]|jgi:hypothetical protein
MATTDGAATSADLWALLTTDRSVQPDTYDKTLCSDLADLLGLEPDDDLEAELVRAAVPVETFVRAFFAVAAPYVMMWSDLLRLYELAGATAGGDNFWVEYNFGPDDDALNFDLGHFRALVAMAQELMAPHWFSAETASTDLWRLTGAFAEVTTNHAYDSGPVGDAEVDAFIAACREGEWPSLLPPMPEVGDPVLAELIAEAWQVAGTFLSAVRAVSSTHESLREVGTNDGREHWGLTTQQLWLIESDFWLPTFVATAVAGVRNLVPQVIAGVTGLLDSTLEPFRNTDDRNRTTTERLQEFLALPLWKYRHELFSNWVCTVVIDSLKDQAPRVHVTENSIVFRFGGTHLATFDSFSPRLHLWTEIRSELADPVGASRMSAIQPDISLVFDPITSPDARPMAIECKQYLKSDNKNFADALTDYVRGLPKALVLLVDYGRVRPQSVLDKVPGDLRGRARVISELRPDRRDALDAFRIAIRSRFDLDAPRSETRQPFAGQGLISLTWTSPPDDLDLHVKVPTPAGEVTVSYQNPGDRSDEPYCTLESDVRMGPGPETVVVHQWLPGRYGVNVQQFSSGGSVQPGQASIDIVTPSGSRHFESPSFGPGDIWNVCTIDGPSGEISAVD